MQIDFRLLPANLICSHTRPADSLLLSSFLTFDGQWSLTHCHRTSDWHLSVLPTLFCLIEVLVVTEGVAYNMCAQFQCSSLFAFEWNSLSSPSPSFIVSLNVIERSTWNETSVVILIALPIWFSVFSFSRISERTLVAPWPCRSISSRGHLRAAEQVHRSRSEAGNNHSAEKQHHQQCDRERNVIANQCSVSTTMPCR